MKALAVIAGSMVMTPLIAAEPAAFEIRQLTPETALKAAQAALAKCRADGYQVSVAVVDRGGNTQVLLRDRYAGAHTVEVSANKAWSAVSFRMNTSDLEKSARAGESVVGIRLPRVTPVGGGLMIESGGSLLGGIGVSGAPGGAADEVCAAAGIRAIADSLEF